MINYASLIQYIDMSESGLYDSAISSSIIISSSSGEAVQAEKEKRVRELNEQVATLENKLVTFLSEIQFADIVVSKCAYPHQLRSRKEQFDLQIKEQQLKQISFNDQVTNLNRKIAKLKAKIDASDKNKGIIANVEKQKQIIGAKQRLTGGFNRYSREENDLKGEFQLQRQQNELQMKKKSQQRLIDYFCKKMGDEMAVIQKLKAKRIDMEDRLENEKIMNQLIEVQRNETKDKKLIDDRVRLLESNIQRLKKNIEGHILIR